MENANSTTKPIRVLIVDDEEEARNLLERLMYRLPDVEVIGKASSADEALDMVINCLPDLVFLDVQMPEKNGFQLVDYFKKYLLNTRVVFVTAHAEFAINAMKISAFDYLLKPVLISQLTDTILRFKAERRLVESDRKPSFLSEKSSRPCKIKFNTRTGYILVSPEEIMYCEADVNYTTIYLGKDNREIVTINLGRMEEILAPYSFYRISRSILINPAYLSKADRQKKKCLLVKADERVFLDIPPNHIRELEKLLDSSNEPLS
jgi:two-component system, LytTR family, response regulator